MLREEKRPEPRSPFDSLMSCSSLLEDTFGSEVRENGWQLIIEPTVNELNPIMPDHENSITTQIPRYLYMLMVTIVHPASAIPEHLESVASAMQTYIGREGGLNLNLDPYQNARNTLNVFAAADGSFAEYSYSMLSLFGQSLTPPPGISETASE